MTRWSLRPVLALLFALSNGCVWVGDNLYNDRIQHLDEDGDLDLHFSDCDNEDPNRHKPIDGVDNEIPYDGIDENCDDQHLDIVDVDGDGYPKLTKAQWEALIPETETEGEDVNYPSGMNEEVDCNDDDATVHPAASDAPYNGVDSNCDGLNDYDRDQDGYVPDAYAAVAGTGVQPGDCDDTKASVHPGAGPDTFYDGEDTDCAGNNDFDADNDSWMPFADDISQEVAWEGKFTTFCAKYNLGDTLQECMATLYPSLPVPTDPRWGDCADDATKLPNELFTPDQVNPEPPLPDAAYDGVDSDCDGGNDFDKDGDGYVKRGREGEFDAYVTFYGYVFSGGGIDDCNDNDDTIHAGVMEILGDNTDQDCDATGHVGDDTTPFISGDYTWTNPRNVVVGKNDLHYVLMTGADATNANTNTNTQPALALIFDPASAFNLKPTLPNVIFYSSNGIPLTDKPLASSVALLATGSNIFGAIDYVDAQAVTPYNYQMTKSAVFGGTNYGSPVAGYYNFRPPDLVVDLDIVIDSSQQIWTLGCGPTLFELFRAVEAAGPPRTVKKFGGVVGTDSTDGIDVDYPGATTCFIDAIIDESHATVTTCDSTACNTWDMYTGSTVPAVLGTIALSATQPHSAEAWGQVNRRDPWFVGTNADGVTLTDLSTSFDLLAGHEAIYADVAEDPNGTVYIAAAVADEDSDGNDDVLFAYGDPAGTMTVEVSPFTVDGVTYSAKSASVYADESRVFTAASGTGATSGVDMMAWAFMGPPP